ncbi:hypothetical protein QMP26_19320 [Enterocloster clostridioformis]
MTRTRNSRIKGVLGNFILPAILICVIFAVVMAPALNKVIYKRQGSVMSREIFIPHKDCEDGNQNPEP